MEHRPGDPFTLLYTVTAEGDPLGAVAVAHARLRYDSTTYAPVCDLDTTVTVVDAHTVIVTVSKAVTEGWPTGQRMLVDLRLMDGTTPISMEDIPVDVVLGYAHA